MGNTLISLFVAAGTSAWLYTKFMKYSGNNSKSTWIATAICFGLIFFVFYEILSLFIK